jgi:hypothetical protein
VKRNKAYTEDPKMLGATVKFFVATAAWCIIFKDSNKIRMKMRTRNCSCRRVNGIDLNGSAGNFNKKTDWGV